MLGSSPGPQVFPGHLWPCASILPRQSWLHVFCFMAVCSVLKDSSTIGVWKGEHKYSIWCKGRQGDLTPEAAKPFPRVGVEKKHHLLGNSAKDFTWKSNSSCYLFFEHLMYARPWVLWAVSLFFLTVLHCWYHLGWFKMSHLYSLSS